MPLGFASLKYRAARGDRAVAPRRQGGCAAEIGDRKQEMPRCVASRETRDAARLRLAGTPRLRRGE